MIIYIFKFTNFKFKNCYIKIFQKSKSPFRFWTFFLSNFEKGKYFWVKKHEKTHPPHFDLLFFLMQKKVLAYFFLINLKFLKNYLGVFFVIHL